MTAPSEPGRTYSTLDGLRGVAAIIVVARHAGQVFPGDPFPESFLAVDLFFLLSGFVIASAYEARLLAGEGIFSFLRTRMTRLYPLYALGLGLGAVGEALGALQQGRPPDLLHLAEAGAIGLLMLPAVPPLPMGSSALDGPTWTLLPELLVNLVYAKLVRRLSTRAVFAVVAAGAVGVVLSEEVYGTLDGGWWPATFPLVAARLGFSFFLGVGFFRLRPERRRAPWAAWGALIVLAATLAIQPGERLHSLHELLLVLGVFPLVTWWAVGREPGPLGARVFGWLGLSSYAVYVIHQPLGVIAGVLLAPFGVQASWATAALFMIAVAMLATVADAVYDRPVRRRLSRLGGGGGLGFPPALAAAEPPRQGGEPIGTGGR